MISWGVLKSYILDGLLQVSTTSSTTTEVTDDIVYTSAQLLTWARWACSEVSYHTAQAAQERYLGDGVTKKWLLPPLMIDAIEKTALVMYDDGKTQNFLPPLKVRPDLVFANGHSQRAYYEWPMGTLSLAFIVPNGQSVTLDYFKIWTPPTDDNSIMEFPQWMEMPFAYFVAAYAMEPVGVQASRIRQWNRKQDSGNPEHNPLHRQTEHFIAMANRLLNKATPQDRDKFFDPDSKSLGIR
jgi:hypothetical protein